ncbi:MAG: DoxX family protein [Novosphingobium sp.]
MSTIAAVIGRILLAIIFVNSGIGKLMNVAATEQTITGVGLPSGFAIPVGVFELVAGLCLIFGIMTRLAAILLAVFTFLATIFYHSDFTDPNQLAHALKNLAIIGGMLLVFAHSQMWWSWDRMRAARGGEIAARRAEVEAHEAQLRAARAEGAASVAGTVPTDVRTDGRTVVTDVDGDGVPEVRRRRRWF